MSNFMSFVDTETATKPTLFHFDAGINFNDPETPMIELNSKYKNNFVPVFDECMPIFLRLRPQNGLLQSSYSLLDDVTLCAEPPEDSVTFKNLLHGNGKGYQKFTFSKILCDDSNQKAVFNISTRSMIQEFIRGSDRLLFAYGTTSSGKTYTMSGQKAEIGIIPRTLLCLFKNVRITSNLKLMPIDFNSVVTIKSCELQQILKDKATLLKLSQKESREVLNSFNCDGDDIEELNLNDIDDQSDPINCDASNGLQTETTFWISYAEIYNEYVYDLLDVQLIQSLSYAGNGQQNINKGRRSALEIRAARSGGCYIRGLKCYPVFSAEEAFRLLLIGRKSQKMGATKLNQCSSRSHAIFTIRAIKYVPNTESVARVYNMSFCDLAGSERTNKAQTAGLAQKEACNINTSLLALGRCIEVLRYNQNNPANQRVIPFRDSKLTRLFQTFFTGNGRAAMIVCLNQDSNLFDESLQVLKFSAIARKVVLHEKPKCEQLVTQKLSIYRRLGLSSPQKSRVTWDDFDEAETIYEDEEEDYIDDRKELLEVIEELKRSLMDAKKDKIMSESKLRQELNDDWMKMIAEIEAKHNRRFDEYRQYLKKESNHQKQLKQRRFKKRKIGSEIISEESDSDYDDSINSSVDVESNRKNDYVNDLEAKLKESQEDVCYYKGLYEDAVKTNDLNVIRIRELEFDSQLIRKSVLVSANINKNENKSVCIQTENHVEQSNVSVIPTDLEDVSFQNIDSRSKNNRFSTVSIVSKFSEKVDSLSNESCSSVAKEPFFQPMYRSDCSNTEHVQNVVIEEVDNESDSFTVYENLYVRLPIELEEKSKIIKSLESEIEELKISQKENYSKIQSDDINSDELLRPLFDVAGLSDKSFDISTKLHLLISSIQRVRLSLEKMPQSVLANDENYDPADNLKFHQITSYINYLEDKYQQLIDLFNKEVIDIANELFHFNFERLSNNSNISVFIEQFHAFWNVVSDVICKHKKSVSIGDNDSSLNISGNQMVSNLSDKSETSDAN